MATRSTPTERRGRWVTMIVQRARAVRDLSFALPSSATTCRTTAGGWAFSRMNAAPSAKVSVVEQTSELRVTGFAHLT